MNESLLFSAEKSIRSLSYDALSAAQRVFFLVWELESEVNNGGFWQYFYNSSGKYAPQVVDALTEIGANQCSEIVKQAISLIAMCVEDWSDDAQRKKIIGNLSEDVKEYLNALDTRFYSYPDDLSSLLAAFVTAHSQDFDV